LTRYVFEASETEHARLLRMARFFEEHAREACRRVGLGPGGAAVEFGCGPVGALLALSDVVGPGGVVVGVDRSAPALEQARAILAAHRREGVRLVCADLHALAPAAVCPPGPFDLAFCHFVLLYHVDPAAALRRMAAVVRPGGHVVVQELPDAPLPVPHPFAAAAEAVVNRWFFPLLGRLGAAPDVARRFSEVCRDAGLEEVGQRVFAPAAPAGEMPEAAGIYRDVLLGLRPALLQHGVAPAHEIDAVLQDLEDTQTTAYTGTAFGHLNVELIARVP
jgi:ubiquinone/menaquinone biosynthesis C-methylase UbiE